MGLIPGPDGHRRSRRHRSRGWFGLVATAVVLSCATAADAAVPVPSLDTAKQAVGQATEAAGTAAPAVQQVKQPAAAPTPAVDAVKPTPVSDVVKTVVETVKQAPAPAPSDTLAGAGGTVQQIEVQVKNTVEQSQAQIKDTLQQTQAQLADTVQQTQTQVNDTVQQTQAQLNDAVAGVAGVVEKTAAPVETKITEIAVRPTDQSPAAGTTEVAKGSTQLQVVLPGGSGSNNPPSGPDGTMAGPSGGTGGTGPHADGGGSWPGSQAVSTRGASASPLIASRDYVEAVAGGGAGPVTKSGGETQRVIAPIDSAARLASGASRPLAPSQPAPSLPLPPGQDLPALGSTSSFVFLLFGFLAALAFFSAPARSSFTRRSQAGAAATQRFALLLERPG